MSGYVTDEIFLLDNLGIEHLTYSPRSYGIDFYGDNFFTRRDLVDEDPSLAARFRDATIRGWKDARDDPHAAIDLILKKYSQRKSRAHLLFEANKTLELMTNLTMPGQMERERWEAMGATFVQSGFLSSVPDLDDFILDRPVFSLPPWLGQAVAGAVVLIGVLATIASYFYRLNRALQREIFCRLASEQQLRESRDALQKTLSEVKQLREIIPICAYCKKIRDDSGYWEQLETYIKHHAGADFSHGICPDCMEIELAKLP